MPIYKARGKQNSRQGQKINTTTFPRKYARDQYGHRLFSVQGPGNRIRVGLNNTVYCDGIERFKGTAKACIEYCKAHRNKRYVIVALYVSGL
jgi:hypothetical protein